MGEVSSIVSLTKQQIAVYKMAQKPTPQNKVLENVRLEVVEQEKGIYKATLIATDGYKLIRREVDAEPGAKACSMNIPQSVLVAADKVMKTDFDRAYVHDGKIVVRTNPYGEMVPIDESFPIKAEIPFQEQTELRFPETRPFVEQKSSEAFPVKSVVVNPKLLIEALRQFKQSDGMMGGVVIHVGKHDEPILIKSSPDYAWDGNEIVAGVAPIKSDDA